MRPICLAAFRLMMNSNLVGCSTGRSAGFAAFEDLIHIRGSAAVQIVQAHAVGHKPFGFHVFSPAVYRRELALYREFCNLFGKEGRQDLAPARGLRQLGSCLRLGMQFRDPWKSAFLRIAALSRTLRQRVRSLLAFVCSLGRSHSRTRPHARAWERPPSEAPAAFRLAPGAKLDNPVMLPPGCARLAINPLLTGSLS